MGILKKTLEKYNIADLIAEEKKATERLKICIECEHYVQTPRLCSKCGCFMPAKVRLAHMYCPEGKWGKKKGE